MELEDAVDAKVGLAAAAVAVAVSPPVRSVVHKGLVYAVTGVLMVTNSVAALGRGVNRGFQSEHNAVQGGNAGGKRKRPRRKALQESMKEESMKEEA